MVKAEVRVLGKCQVKEGLRDNVKYLNFFQRVHESHWKVLSRLLKQLLCHCRKFTLVISWRKDWRGGRRTYQESISALTAFQKKEKQIYAPHLRGFASFLSDMRLLYSFGRCSVLWNNYFKYFSSLFWWW